MQSINKSHCGSTNGSEICSLTLRQKRALHLIMSGMPLQEVAEKLKVTRQTVSWWKNQHPEFRARLDALRVEAEQELNFAVPMNDAFMMGQLRRLAHEGPHDSRLKAIQFYFGRFTKSDLDIDKNQPLLTERNDMLDRVLSQFRAGEKA